MTLLPTTQYFPTHPILKQFIKYFWVIQSHEPVNVCHKLLPVGNIDIIINFSSDITYFESGQTEIKPKMIHFNSIRDRYYYIYQTGRLEVFGISFFPTGIYPFLKIPLDEFQKETVDLDLLCKEFTGQVEDSLKNSHSVSERILTIENQLLKRIEINLFPSYERRVFDSFKDSVHKLNINQFCDHYGINPRKLERLFNKHIGISPKQYRRIQRFQGILNDIVTKKNSNLTSLAFENEYYDQNHFIKEFKSFTGVTPTKFINEKRSVKEILQIR